MAGKKLLFIHGNLSGGAGIAMQSLANSLLQHGHNIEIVSEDSFLNFVKYKGLTSFLLKARKYIYSRIYSLVVTNYKYEFKDVGFYTIPRFWMRNLLLKLEPEVIFIGSCSRFLNVAVVRDYCLKYNKRVIFIELDDNIFTGGCHYVNDCLQYSSSCCSRCPAVNIFYQHVPRLNYKIKESFLSLNPLVGTFAPFDGAIKKNSFFKLLHMIEVQSISYINTTDFDRYRELKRHLRNTVKDELNVAFVCSNFRDKRKGIDDLILIANSVYSTQKVRFHLFGNADSVKDDFNGINEIILHGVLDKEVLIEWLCHCDVFLNLTKADKGPASLVFSLQIGLPVISYKVGMAKFFVSKNDGYLIDTIGNSGLIINLLRTVNFRSFELVGRDIQSFYSEERLDSVLQSLNEVLEE